MLLIVLASIKFLCTVAATSADIMTCTKEANDFRQV